MKKRILYFNLLISFFLIFLLSSCNNKSDITFELNNDNTYSLVSVNKSSKSIFIPEEYNNLKVTKIKEDAFKNSKIESIIIPNSIIEIGDNAFSGCTSLINLFLSESLKKIGNFAFSSCTKLSNFTISNNLEEIGDYAFLNCYSITKMKLTDSILKIGAGAFMYMENLEEIQLSKSITILNNDTFLGCKQLSKITVPVGVTSIGNKCFYGCSSLSTISIPKSVTKIGIDIISDIDNLKIYYSGLESDYELIQNESKEITDKHIICGL